MPIRTGLGDYRIAKPALAVDNVYCRLYDAYNDAVVTGNHSIVEVLITIIDSWAISTNPEEREAYRIFTSINPYKRLYKKARELLEKERA